jgi:galactonate dehydratase
MVAAFSERKYGFCSTVLSGQFLATMKITQIETIWFEPVSSSAWSGETPHSRQALPNNLWVRIYTDTGLVGLGETYYLPRAVNAVIHDLYAALLIGRDPVDIENHWNNLFSLANFCGFAGAEMRAISAIDIALWDLLGQYLGQPIYNVLGGRNRESIPVYNTCVGYGQYPDYTAWMEGRAGELAKDLLQSGIKAMKIWPFDQFGTTLAGPANPRAKVTIWGQETAAGVLAHDISDTDLRAGIAIVESIRKATGSAMAIAIEGHSRWNLPTATRIARALEPYDILWLEEIMPPDNSDAFVRLKASTSVPLCQSERVFTRYRFRDFIEKAAADIIMPDPAWGGGITETRKVCSLADTYYLPITLHDTIGPVALWAAAHLMLHIPNAMIQEVVRGYVYGWYNDILADPLVIEDGLLRLNGKPGLGTSLRDDVVHRPGVHVEVSTEAVLKVW